MEGNDKLLKIGFGGGCHWCTEGVFAVLRGIEKVDQGWISSTPPYNTFSEAVIVHYNPSKINLDVLIQIHLETHQSASNHSMRNKYRSAIYTFGDEATVNEAFEKVKQKPGTNYITQVLPFADFKPSLEIHRNYYMSNPEKPFCKTYIDPKIRMLMKEHAEQVDRKRLNSV